MNQKRNILKYFLFSLSPLLFLILITEVGLRAAYYQKKASHTFAISYGIETVKRSFIKETEEKKVADLINELNSAYLKQDIVNRLSPQFIDQKIHQALYSNIGETILNRFKKEYEEHFDQLVTEVKNIQSKLVILYIPIAEEEQSKRLNICRNYFHNLAVVRGINFVDLTDRFYQYPYHWVTLSPENHHLSRFGNILVADALSAYIENNVYYRSPHRFDKRSALFGDLPKSLKETKAKGTSLEYLVVTNTQGLRMNYDLSFPKTK